MSGLSKVKAIVRAYGIGGFLRLAVGAMYMRSTMWLVAKEWDPQADAGPIEVPDITLREATRQDVPAIVEAWPPEFGELASDRAQLNEVLLSRFDMGIPAYVALHEGEVWAGLWCKPWPLERVLPPSRRGLGSYEFFNIFTVPASRGRGLAVKLVQFAMIEMAGRGKRMAVSRIMDERQPSLIMHDKVGFERLGMLTSGRIVGRRFARLDRSVLTRTPTGERGSS